MPFRPRPVPTAEQLDRIERCDMYRAGGDVICKHCGKLYYDHPYFAEPYEWLTIVCNGDIVKL
jgi:hypothetical protein